MDQQGSLLVEFMIVAILSLALAVWAGQEWARRARALQARALAAWMEPARQTAEAFLRQQADALMRADTPTALAAQGVADWSAPTWAELRATGLLPPGWEENGPLGQTLDLRIVRDGSCPQTPCRLQALIASRTGLLHRQGGVDEELVAEWLQASGGRGLVVWPRQPGLLRGAGLAVAPDSAWGWGAGTVALAVWLPIGTDPALPPGGSTDDPDHLRVRDPRDPDFQGDASVAGAVRSGTWLQARDGLVLDKGWRGNAACSTDRALGRDERYPGLLICLGGTWQQLARPAGGGYMYNSRKGCASATGVTTANPLTGSCSCAAGYSDVQVAESGSLTALEGLSRGYLCLPNR
ncbi:hypothetical protein [Castellaniella sp. MT123]|uniref:hypothetical protein n=1 Tax=Castellaniella sp. MT123 TaxID=3140381 RepID=UPI0031F41B61